MTMDPVRYANKFLEMLRYVKYVRDDKVKIQQFLIGMPQTYKDIIEFHEHWTLDEAIRNVDYYCDQYKRKQKFDKELKDKRMGSLTKIIRGSSLFNLKISRGSHHMVLTKPSRMMGYNQRDKRVPL